MNTSNAISGHSPDPINCQFNTVRGEEAARQCDSEEKEIPDYVLKAAKRLAKWNSNLDRNSPDDPNGPDIRLVIGYILSQ